MPKKHLNIWVKQHITVDEAANHLLECLRQAFSTWIGGGPAFDHQEPDEELLAYCGPGEHVEVIGKTRSYRIGTPEIGVLVSRFEEFWRGSNPFWEEVRPTTWRIESYGWPNATFYGFVGPWEVSVTWDGADEQVQQWTSTAVAMEQALARSEEPEGETRRALLEKITKEVFEQRKDAYQRLA